MKAMYAKLSMYSLLISAATSLMISPASAEQSSITVTVSGLRSQDGNVIVCLWQQQDEGFPICADGTTSFEPIAIEAADSVDSTVTALFQNIPPGDYAVSAFHDEDQDGSIDRGFMGRPKEGITFSNMNQERRERPSFDHAKFTLNGEQTISLSLKYF
jgi:uncharacterized protein (DUF2141 family)